MKWSNGLENIMSFDPIKDNKGYTDYRIPGMIITKKGTIIVYWESRNRFVNHDFPGIPDQGLSDLYIIRSTNNGESFGERILIAKGEEYRASGHGETINNPVMIVDHDNTIHLIYSCNVGEKGVWYTRSHDDGLSWDKPKDISPQLRGIAWKELACGPTHGICCESGRLIATVWVNIGVYDVYTIYSDDKGKTWNFGEKVSENRDESCLAELSDGSVIISSRQYTYPYSEKDHKRASETAYRVMSRSKDGISGWSKSEYDENLPDPACAASILSSHLDNTHVLLFCNCCSKYQRERLLVRFSTDNGETWSCFSLLISQNSGGYCDMALSRDGRLFVCFEESCRKENYSYIAINLFSIDISQILTYLANNLDNEGECK